VKQESPVIISDLTGECQENPEEKSPILTEQIPEETIKAQLTMMSEDWLGEMQRAALTARESKIRDLIEQINPEYSELADYLTKLLNNLEFEQIQLIVNC
jgi:hypothetical protein